MPLPCVHGSGESRSSLSSHVFSLLFLLRTMVSRQNPAPTLPRGFGGADVGERAQHQRKTATALVAGLPPLRRSPVSLLLAAARLSDGQLLVCLRPLLGWSPDACSLWPFPSGCTAAQADHCLNLSELQKPTKTCLGEEELNCYCIVPSKVS